MGKKCIERKKKSTDSVNLFAEAKANALEIRNNVENNTPTRKQPCRIPKYVSTNSSMKEDTSDLTIASNKFLKQSNVKLKKKNKQMEQQLTMKIHGWKNQISLLKSENTIKMRRLKNLMEF